MLPNLFIIGGIKCASTSLHEYLAHHPQIAMSEPKELHHFDRDDWAQRMDSYGSHFVSDKPVRGESTAHYSWYPHRSGVPERIHSVVPDARFIYIVRDPVDRIVAHWIWCYTNGNRTTWNEWMATAEDPANALVCASRYALQLDQYLEFFPRESILVLDQADLKHRRIETLSEAFRFLGVDETFRTPAWDVEHNSRRERALTPLGWKIWRRFEPDFERMPAAVGQTVHRTLQRVLATDVVRPEVAPETRARLEEILRPDVERLREMTGRSFSTWSI